MQSGNWNIDDFAAFVLLAPNESVSKQHYNNPASLANINQTTNPKIFNNVV
jgi:hypothetical protein